MVDSAKIQVALGRVRDQRSFIQDLLIETLGWPIEGDIEQIEDISFAWTAEELNAEGLDKKITDGQIWQIQRLEKAKEQPWGIFLLEFKNADAFVSGRGLTGPLRRVLRGLVPKRRTRANLPSWEREHLLFICTHNYQHFCFAYFKAPKTTQTAPLARFGWGPDISCRTACEFNLPPLEWPENPEDLADWTKQWQKAFDKQKLTEEFFKEYKNIFNVFEQNLAKQTQNQIWAHDYALQFLNRCMFLYFIQRKGWLGQDKDFLKSFWLAYENSGQPQDSFFENWLKVLFFEAFNNRFRGGRGQFPPEIREALSLAPYLNGGLFRENKLDLEHDVKITDKEFEQVITFFDCYNFTITEDTPLDIEVAVDAEMLGMVYESLVNISEDEDRRGEAGIFYTPRVEIDMMCRLSLVDYLANHLGQKHKDLLYDWIFIHESQIDAQLISLKLVEPLYQLLSDIKVVDPACGSGSFLVGMLSVLDNLRERLERINKKERSLYDRRKEIIGSNLYGVDVKDWACHVAELRLWLSLIIDAQLTEAELHVRREPLLPNFSFNIRCGDSLVQEIGGIDMAHRRGVMELSQNIKRKLTELKNEKIRFYNNDPDRKFQSADQLEQQEVLVFRQLLEDRIKAAEAESKNLMRIQAEKSAHQQRNLITGELEGPAKQFTIDYQARENQIASLKEEQQRLKITLETTRDKATVPFVWDIAFAEVMADDKGGFDIVIGNPPYVRGQNICDPQIPREKTTTENKKEYKEKLSRSVYKTYPAYFDYKPATDKAGRQLDKKSDLYIYFYFHGLSLLNPEGSFCFITSNSWLDVGYGADLQEFLLKRCQVRMIIDNKAKRSFKSADINTIIALLSPPQENKVPDEVSLEKQARFVMFNLPFEEIVDSVVFRQIESVKDRLRNDKFQLFPITQQRLFEEGCEIPDEDEQPKKKTKSPGIGIKIAKYIGNKWGGKYLRAPDVLVRILQERADVLTRIGGVAEVDSYLNTGGADDFFFVDAIKCNKRIARVRSRFDEHEWEIEDRFLKVFLESPRQLTSRTVESSALSTRILVVPPEESLKGTLVASYIAHGKTHGFPNASGRRNLKPWYRPPANALEGASLLWPCRFNDIFYVCWNPSKVISHRFYRLVQRNSQTDTDILWVILNSSWTWLCAELFAGSALGAGVLDINGETISHIPIPQPWRLPKRDLLRTTESLQHEPLEVIERFISSEALRSVDNVIFESIGLTKGERDAVYEAVIDLVESRLKKATSLDE